MADASDYMALFGGDEGVAQDKAAALANAIRQRRTAGMMLGLSGDPAMSGVGQELTGQADKLDTGLLGAAQHRAQQAIEGKRYAVESARMAAQQEHWNQLEEIAARNAGLKENEVGATTDAMGNPILYRKHGQAGALPGATRAAGGGVGGAGPMGILTPEAQTMLADQFRKTGQIPQVGRGKAAPAIIAGIVNAAAKAEPGVDLAGNKAAYHADTSSLSKQQTLLDLTKSWENTGKANLGVLRETVGQLVNTGSPLLNAPVRMLYQKVGGDPMVTKFKAAHAAVVNEYAKILSGAMGSAGVTEGARHEAEQMMPLDSTPAQIAAAADLLERDAGNRLASLTQQVAETKGRLSGKKAPESQAEGQKTNDPLGIR